MIHPSSPAEAPEQSIGETLSPRRLTSTEPESSYVKLAMRNMVRKGGTSLKHFFLSTVALLGVLVGLAYLTR